MSRELVGLENLPNAYIKQIVVSDKDQGHFKFKIHVNLKDLRQNDFYVWSMDKILSPKVDVGLISLTDEALIEQLSTGLISPLDKTMRPFLQMRQAQNKTPTEEMVDYNHQFEVDYKNDISNLTVFAFCFINDMSTHGPIKSEKIIENFEISNRSTVFLLPDSTPWSGPVHQHDGIYMVGSQHVDRFHPTLRTQSVKNFKIKNLTKKLKVRESIEPKRGSYFSDLYMSSNDRTNYSGMFSVNILKVLLTETKNGRFLRKSTNAVLSEILAKFSIKGFYVQRERVRLDKRMKTKEVVERHNISYSSDNLGVLRNLTRVLKNNYRDVSLTELPSSSTERNMDPQKIYAEEINEDNTVSQVKEIFLGNRGLRSFSFSDYSLSNQTLGKYRYKVKIDFVDPTIEFANSMAGKIERDLSGLKNYFEFKSRRMNYDYVNNRSKIDQYTATDLDVICNNYVKYYSYIYNTTALERANMIEQSYSLLSPKNSTIADTKKFLEKYKNLKQEIFKDLVYVDKKSQNTTGKFKLKNISLKNHIAITKEFSNLVDPSNNKINLNYLPNEQFVGIKIFTKQQYSTRVLEEIQKFYISTPNFQTSENASIDSNVLVALGNISVNSYQYLSPVSLNEDKKSISMKKTENLNPDSINRVVRNKINRRKASKFSIKKAIQFEKSEQGSFLPIGDVIGTSTTQANYSENDASVNETPEEILSKSKIEDSMLNLNSKKLRKKDFDLSSSGFTLPATECQKLPLQIKSLIGSNLDSTKNAILKSPRDTLQNPETSNVINLNFLAIQEIQYLKGYKTTVDGDVDLKSPVWSPLKNSVVQDSQQPLVCRMVNYSNSSIKVDVDTTMLGDTSDGIFIIYDGDVSKSPNQASNENIINNTIFDNATFEYLNSNIVSQTSETPVTTRNTPRQNNNKRNTISRSTY